MERRTDYVQDLDSGVRIEIRTCMGCPDSRGFLLKENELIVEEPICDYWHNRASLFNFPLIPFWCPRMEDLEPEMSIRESSPEQFLQKRQAFQNLSREAKQVLNVLFNLPEEFISKNKVIARSIISRVAKGDTGGHRRAKIVESIFNELRKFTQEILS